MDCPGKYYFRTHASIAAQCFWYCPGIPACTRASLLISKKHWHNVVLTHFVLQRFSVTICENSAVLNIIPSKPKIDCYLCQFSLLCYQVCISKSISKHYLSDCIAAWRVWLVLLWFYCFLFVATFNLTCWCARGLVVSRVRFYLS